MDLIIQVVYVWWGIWYQHNQVVFRHSNLHPSHLLLMVDKMRHEFKSAVAPALSIPNASRDNACWLLPSRPQVKINTDAAVHGRYSKVGLGVVVRNETGEVLMSAGKVIDEYLDMEMAELKALLFGLSLAVEHSFLHVILESDSLYTVARLNSY